MLWKMSVTWLTTKNLIGMSEIEKFEINKFEINKCKIRNLRLESIGISNFEFQINQSRINIPFRHFCY